MPQSDDFLSEDQKVMIEDITFRSNRLREWLEFEAPLRALEKAYNDFYRKVQKHQESASASRLAEVKQNWNICKITAIEDIKSFAKSAQYINKSFPSTSSHQVMPLMENWIQELLDLGNIIQVDLINSEHGSLYVHSEEFLMKLSSRISDRRYRLQIEVKELCDVTIKLRLMMGL